MTVQQRGKGVRLSVSIALATLLALHAPWAHVFAAEETEKPVQSPSHKLFAYATVTKDAANHLDDTKTPSILWLGEVSTGRVHPLFKAGTKVRIESLGLVPISNLRDITFSHDNNDVYFLCHAWATSMAVISINLSSARMRFVCPGNSLEVIRHGKWKGNLIVEQHRYHHTKSGGSYDWLWLITPRGKEIGIWQKQEGAEHWSLSN